MDAEWTRLVFCTPSFLSLDTWLFVIFPELENRSWAGETRCVSHDDCRVADRRVASTGRPQSVNGSWQIRENGGGEDPRYRRYYFAFDVASRKSRIGGIYCYTLPIYRRVTLGGVSMREVNTGQTISCYALANIDGWLRDALGNNGNINNILIASFLSSSRIEIRIIIRREERWN